MGLTTNTTDQSTGFKENATGSMGLFNGLELTQEAMDPEISQKSD